MNPFISRLGETGEGRVSQVLNRSFWKVVGAAAVYQQMNL